MKLLEGLLAIAIAFAALMAVLTALGAQVVW